ncbi:MAG: AraC family transcriptional regulator [Pseudomonadales bacterium]|nr:AraC family transcriptional regulator [Pseudomonadales bacterium]NRA16261.1 AraC family transcriptional regulator [Oceanospirillaceae bacterium]
MHLESAPDFWLQNHQLQRMQQILSYIESSLDQPLGVDQLAEKIHWSRWQFQRVFNRETGTSVAHYVRSLRLSNAAKLLLTTQNRQIDIALECGFDSEISFNKSFRKNYHCTPGNYRKRGQYQGLQQPMALSRPDKMVPEIEPKLLQIKIETQPATCLYGIKALFNGIFSDAENFEQIVPTLWQELKETTSLEQSSNHFGVIDLTAVNDLHTDIPYWACIKTDDIELQKRLQRVEIPEQQYAVLPHRGPAREMVKTLQWFILEWLPNSNYQGMNGFDLEHYSDNFISDNSSAYMEYWVPVTPK